MVLRSYYCSSTIHSPPLSSKNKLTIAFELIVRAAPEVFYYPEDFVMNYH